MFWCVHLISCKAKISTLYSCVTSVRLFKAPLLHSVSAFHEPIHKLLYLLVHLRMPCPVIINRGSSTRGILRGGVTSPTPNPQPGGLGLRIYVPWRQDGPAIPRTLGAHCSHLLWHAWDTLGLLFFSGHHMGKNITLLSLFPPSEMLIPRILDNWPGGGDKNLRNDASDIIIHCLYGQFTGNRKMNDACRGRNAQWNDG
jgi:hypothetical protein